MHTTISDNGESIIVNMRDRKSVKIILPDNFRKRYSDIDKSITIERI